MASGLFSCSSLQVYIRSKYIRDWHVTLAATIYQYSQNIMCLSHVKNTQKTEVGGSNWLPFQNNLKNLEPNRLVIISSFFPIFVMFVSYNIIEAKFVKGFLAHAFSIVDSELIFRQRLVYLTIIISFESKTIAMVVGFDSNPSIWYNLAHKFIDSDYKYNAYPCRIAKISRIRCYLVVSTPFMYFPGYAYLVFSCL